MLQIETMLGRLGSRFTLHFPKTSENCIYTGPLGKYYDHKWDMSLGLRAKKKDGSLEVVRMLPYTANSPHFPEVEQEITMNSVKWKALDRQYWLRGEFTITAPFYPRDIKLSSAPFFYIEAEVRAPSDWEVELVVGLSNPAQVSKIRTDINLSAVSFTSDYKMVAGHWGPREPKDSYSAAKVYSASLTLSYTKPTGDFEMGKEGFVIAGHRNVKASFILATHIAEPVMEIREEPYRFKYLDYFKDVQAVIEYARNNEAEIKRKSTLFDNLFKDCSLGNATQNLLAQTFQSYIPNSWWAVPVKGGEDWYSCWEGNCTFHSTVDVEYNLAWFYLLLWPELLEMTLAEWRHYLRPVSENSAFMSHDIGALLGANKQAYPHEMEVEESANFILLAYALWRYTGKAAVVQDNSQAVARLTQYILDSATTGSGFPSEGTANTVDDASPAVQFGREQTYLAVKAMSALHAAAFMLDSEPLAEACRERVELINQTLNQRAWLDDHYAVCLDRTTDGLINPWSGEPLPPGELEGWNAYSLYTSNGLLYLLATDAPLPPGDYARFTQDIIESRAKSMSEYGCYHSSADHSHIWVSQNLHRDHTGAFLGIDPAGMAERYWAFEQYENSVGRGGCFVDTYGGNHLRYYPRGITSLGMLAALPGAKLDRVTNKLSLNPVRVPLKLPLLALAQWENEKIPWVEFSLENGQIKRTLTHLELLPELD